MTPSAAQTADTEQQSPAIKTRQVLKSDQVQVLSKIYQEDSNLVIWQRNLKPALQTAINRFLQEADVPLRLSQAVTPNSTLAYISSALKRMECANDLSENIAELVDMFCCLFDLKQAGLRLTSLDRAMCPKFHVDLVPCRLVTTYQGLATEWLPHHSVDRSKLGAGSGGRADEESGLFQDSAVIQQLGSGDVALLKGELWDGNENAGLVHRSPTLAPGKKRLLLTLDFIV